MNSQNKNKNFQIFLCSLSRPKKAGLRKRFNRNFTDLQTNSNVKSSETERNRLREIGKCCLTSTFIHIVWPNENYTNFSNSEVIVLSSTLLLFGLVSFENKIAHRTEVLLNVWYFFWACILPLLLLCVNIPVR